MKHPWIALLLMLLSLAAFRAESAPDDLDPSFGTGGQHFFEVFNEYDGFRLNVNLLPLPNGDIAVSDGFPWLRRTSANAERTETFDLAFACADVPADAPCGIQFGALARQPDGKIVIAFTVWPTLGNPTRKLGVVRLQADGRPDLSFGTAGTAAVSPASGGTPFPSGISIQPDGGLLVAGSISFRDLVLTRFLASGEPDRTFGAGGILRFDRFTPLAFLQTSNGNLVLASFAALMRLLPNGQVDATFDAHEALGSFFAPGALAEQADGKLVVAGFSTSPNPPALAVMRLDAQGRRDASFGTGGMVVLPIDDDRAFISAAVALDSRGRIVVSGNVDPIRPPWVSRRIGVARFLPDGAVDTFFAGGGVTTLETPSTMGIHAVVITPSDGILIGGTSGAGPLLLRLHGGEGSVSRPVREERAIEFFHAGFGHYFIAATQREIATLDNPSCVPPCEVSRPWQRTGRSFRVWSGNAPHLSAACRFFSGQSFAPKSSHFHTPYAEECASLRAGSIWTFEGEPFRLQLPTATPAGLVCPAGSVPLYRAYNNGLGGAPNHRYTDDPAILASMLDQGWAFEGDVQTKVFACIPPP
jgi:uncharacterized delta-60 repeat protein